MRVFLLNRVTIRGLASPSRQKERARARKKGPKVPFCELDTEPEGPRTVYFTCPMVRNDRGRVSVTALASPQLHVFLNSLNFVQNFNPLPDVRIT